MAKKNTKVENDVTEKEQTTESFSLLDQMLAEV